MGKQSVNQEGKSDPLKDKSFAMAIRIVKLYKYLTLKNRNMCYQSNYCEVALILGLWSGKQKMLKVIQIGFTN